MICVKTDSQILNIPIEDIIPNRFQPRLNFDESGLQELAASIKEHGIIQPLVLRRLGDKYEIIAGERRYKASKLAGLTSVPGIISSMDDQKSAEVAIVENVQRRDLSSIEEAKSYKALLDKGYLTQEELAKKMGLSQSAISNKLRLLTLSPLVQEALMEGKISERHARSLLQVPKEEQNSWLKTIIDERITVRDLDKRIKDITNTEQTYEEEIPITEVIPNIEINESIIAENEEPKIDIFSAENNKQVPNKFFNYLEDESVNMNITEENEKTFEEEIELLDFIAPIENKIDDNKIINELIEKLENELKINNYIFNISKDENEKIIKFTIEVEKNKKMSD